MQFRFSLPAVLTAAVLAANYAHGAGRQGIGTYLSYNPADSKYDLTQPFLYQSPDPAVYGPGPYPVFLWVPGSFEVSFDPLSLLFVAEMSKRGFLAASVEYSNVELAQTCQAYTARAQGVFDATRSTSAISAICSLPNANCSKGIAVAGISQGGVLAVLARNYEPAVQAVYALSAGAYNHAGIGVNLGACMNKAATAIPANRLMIVNGQADPAFGSQSSTEDASGFTCPAGSTQCWSPDGSGAGWYIVQNSQVKDGTAGHCYIDQGGCNDLFDPNWRPPATNNWSLQPNLDWLATMGTRRVISQ
ncbi:MAG: hypothetical protein JO323_08605 [Acidobacteriia bacterium]|nr:hypothetical protein [Terriglobia bacterium]